MKPGVEDPPLPPVRRRSFEDKAYGWVLVFLVGCALAGITGTIVTANQPQYLFGKCIERCQ